jgi:hypothetical protein
MTCDDGTIDVMKDDRMLGYIKGRKDLNSDCNGPRFYSHTFELYRKEELDAISAKMGEFEEVSDAADSV